MKKTGRNNQEAIIDYLDKCRICGNKDTYNFITLPNMPMPLGHIEAGNDQSAFQLDIPLHWCPKCYSVQTLQDVVLSGYYGDYTYSTSSSPLVRDFMEYFAEALAQRFILKPDSFVVEVGSGDGYQMMCFKNLGMQVLGIEPSEPLALEAQKSGVDTLQTMFDKQSLQIIAEKYPPIDVLILQYTFDHLPDPVPFLKSLKPFINAESGIVVIEVHDFEKIVERNEACLFTHEHATYLSSETIEQCFNQAGFKLVDTSLVPEKMRRGNSLIAVGALQESNIKPQAKPAGSMTRYLHTREAYDEFARKIRLSHDQLAARIRQMRKEGKKVAGYGAVGRGVNTMAIAGLNADDIDVVYDMNPNLHGLLMPVSNVPVAHPDQVFNDNVDEIIVFCYGYLKEIRDYLRPFIESGGTVTSMLDYLKTR